jgi:hypothetical protein
MAKVASQRLEALRTALTTRPGEVHRASRVRRAGLGSLMVRGNPRADELLVAVEEPHQFFGVSAT